MFFCVPLHHASRQADKELASFCDIWLLVTIGSKCQVVKKKKKNNLRTACNRNKERVCLLVSTAKCCPLSNWATFKVQLIR